MTRYNHLFVDIGQNGDYHCMAYIFLLIFLLITRLYQSRKIRYDSELWSVVKKQTLEPLRGFPNSSVASDKIFKKLASHLAEGKKSILKERFSTDEEQSIAILAGLIFNPHTSISQLMKEIDILFNSEDSQKA